MENNNLTSHEVHDSFYASPDQQAHWEATRDERSAAIRRIVLGVFGVILLGALSPLTGAFLPGSLGGLAVIPPILMGVYSLSGFFGFYYEKEPFSPVKKLARGDPVRLRGAAQTVRSLFAGMLSLPVTVALLLFLEETAPQARFAGFTPTAVCLLFAVDGLVLLLSKKGVWAWCGARCRANIVRRVRRYAEKHPDCRFSSDSGIVKTLPHFWRAVFSRAARITVRTLLAAAATVGLAAVLHAGIGFTTVAVCIGVPGLYLALQICLEPWLSAHDPESFGLLQMRLYQLGVLNAERDAAAYRASRQRALYKELCRKYPDAQTLPLEELTDTQKKDLGRMVAGRRFRISLAFGLTVIAVCVVLIVLGFREPPTLWMLLTGIFGLVVGIVLPILGPFFLFGDVNDKALLKQEFRAVTKGKWFTEEALNEQMKAERLEKKNERFRKKHPELETVNYNALSKKQREALKDEVAKRRLITDLSVSGALVLAGLVLVLTANGNPALLAPGILGLCAGFFGAVFGGLFLYLVIGVSDRAALKQALRKARKGIRMTPEPEPAPKPEPEKKPHPKPTPKKKKK